MGRVSDVSIVRCETLSARGGRGSGAGHKIYTIGGLHLFPRDRCCRLPDRISTTMLDTRSCLLEPHNNTQTTGIAHFRFGHVPITLLSFEDFSKHISGGKSMKTMDSFQNCQVQTRKKIYFAFKNLEAGKHQLTSSNVKW